jgi:NTP pyrophosphatase (non-canonical NTP hydrolase)
LKFETKVKTAMNLKELLAEITTFRDARDWKQFHKANHLAAAIAIEAAELQEHFLWKTPVEVESKIADPQQKQVIAEELADVLIFSLLLAQEIGIDPTQAILRKLKANERKYPVEKARGSAKKYTEL